MTMTFFPTPLYCDVRTFRPRIGFFIATTIVYSYTIKQLTGLFITYFLQHVKQRYATQFRLRKWDGAVSLPRVYVYGHAPLFAQLLEFVVTVHADVVEPVLVCPHNPK